MTPDETRQEPRKHTLISLRGGKAAEGQHCELKTGGSKAKRTALRKAAKSSSHPVCSLFFSKNVNFYVFFVNIILLE